jgi:hypothetical protein
LLILNLSHTHVKGGGRSGGPAVAVDVVPAQPERPARDVVRGQHASIFRKKLMVVAGSPMLAGWRAGIGSRAKEVRQ